MGIGVFSASSPVSADSPTRYLRGKQYLQQQGCRVALDAENKQVQLLEMPVT